jgi:hypothetical protein
MGNSGDSSKIKDARKRMDATNKVESQVTAGTSETIDNQATVGTPTTAGMPAKAGRPATAGTGITTMTPATAEVPAKFRGFRNVNSTKYIHRYLQQSHGCQQQKSFRPKTFGHSYKKPNNFFVDNFLRTFSNLFKRI